MSRRRKALAEDLRIERHGADGGWAMVSRLEPLVYTPEKLAHVAWHEVEWSHAGHWVVGYLGQEPVTAVGIYGREVAVEGATKRAAGIGGVMTHPDHEKKGYATQALDAALAYIDSEIAPDFTLLFVEPHNLAFYEKRGWRPFAGEVIVEERGRRAVFPYMGAMVRDGVGPAPVSGSIDLLGKPW